MNQNESGYGSCKGVNQNRIYDFLLVITSKVDPLLHGFRDTATERLKVLGLIPYLHHLATCGEHFRISRRTLFEKNLHSGFWLQ